MFQETITKIAEKLFPQIAIMLLVGTTAVSGGAAGLKLLSSRQQAPTVQIGATPPGNELREVTGTTPTTAVSGTPKPTGPSQSGAVVTVAKVVGTTVKPTSVPKIQTVASVSVGGASSVSSGCIITLFGKQFDVTSLRSTHSGGDIFSCGTDMTTIYQGRHGTNLTRMQQYAVNASTQVSSVTGTAGTSSSGNTGSTGQTANSSGTSSAGSGSQIGSRRDDHDEEEDDDKTVIVKRETSSREHDD